ncbi:aspartate/methionine/tyrosine aminotransferase [Breznakia sp. PF5-3]|uniref:pyridoxal phosphate-dependent aminotransferase n=1 Tax=unclassified Breznakia TaxID=2623764 RepID=UPI002406B8AA|nr:MULTISPECIES: pyridoxal phosphate-dependent aminotransferase [unclassified Breznakia]MDF9823961.1 aspartate/methionine/tyrosine aminotransferase [Breznakia sp. PM6-1]MDF9834760.1 aspartate/methionine/tyrosine aminotransferase [Breznakia sp. PF5-3]MDF9838368.1 aspartate/methionine/tyrosine aminotransferase [Breznakia sp. PFB2-8]MDF9860384.1 aspartate/methionine/tyrosine aminotransferase [Breznakia sp. PH5-24]
MKQKMRKAFQKFEGGLFSEVEKADVGDSYQKLGEQGVDLMGWADPYNPDFSLPDHVLKATLDAVNAPLSAHYTAPIGNDDLKVAIAKKLKRQNGLEVVAKRNILITPGSDSGLYYAMLSFLDAEDEVMIPTPSYPNNFQNVEILGAKAIPIQLKEKDDFQIDIKEFEKRLTPKTKMVVLTHPNNPTTTVFNESSLFQLADFIIKNDLILVCDQAFEDFTYENKMITPASLPGMWERTITVFSVSKGMGFSGYRVGYLVTNDVIMDALYGAAVSVLGATNSIAQVAVLAAFEDQSFMKAFENSFDYRRKKAYEILNQIPNVSMKLPESGFLCWVDVSKLGNASDIVSYLIQHAKVCVNDGINYGPGGEGHIRIVLGVYKDDERVVDALRRIKSALIDYQK